MALVNIPRGRDDPNYRYKMPKLISKIEGRGNGIKTNISNMGDIARALKRPPMYPTKFMGCELGAMAKFEEAEEKALINGAHHEKDLDNILDKFIEMYVLCPSCDLPETDMSVKKGDILVYKCNACGSGGQMDMKHKAATYMIRNPPATATSTLGKKKKSKDERRAEKKEKRVGEGGGGSNGDDDAGSDEATDEKIGKKKDRSKKSEDRKLKKRKSKETTGCSDDEDDENGGGDTPARSISGGETPVNGSIREVIEPEKVDSKCANDASCDMTDKKKKKKSLSSSSSLTQAREKLLANDRLTFDSPELDDVASRLKSFLENSKDTSPAAFFRELRMLQVSQDFDSKCRVYVVFQALFGSSMIPEDLEEKMAYVKGVIDVSVPPSDVLNALEYYTCNIGLSALSNFPYLLQKLYSAEVLESDEILKHYNINHNRRKKEKNGGDDDENKNESSPMFLKCRKYGEPFLQWLKENESDQSDDEEDDGEENDDGEITSSAPSPIAVNGTNVGAEKGVTNGDHIRINGVVKIKDQNDDKDEEDDDIDVDAI